MAVKVIGQSKDPQKQTTCRNCGAILEYYRVDVKSKNVKDIDGGSDTIHWIDCPQCKQTVQVKGY